MKPIYRLIKGIDALNNGVGKAVSWLVLAMVLLQFSVVVMRYIFGINFIAMQEGVVYLHASVFMVGASYTLLHEGHVRVDIFYREATPARQALVDMIGAVFFLIPVCGVILWHAIPYFEHSWAMGEGSQETSGIQAVFALKFLIVLFASLVGLQGIAMALRSALTLHGDPTPQPKHDEVEV